MEGGTERTSNIMIIVFFTSLQRPRRSGELSEIKLRYHSLETALIIFMRRSPYVIVDCNISISSSMPPTLVFEVGGQTSLIPTRLNTMNLLSFLAKRSSLICSNPEGMLLTSSCVKRAGGPRCKLVLCSIWIPRIAAFVRNLEVSPVFSSASKPCFCLSLANLPPVICVTSRSVSLVSSLKKEQYNFIELSSVKSLLLWYMESDEIISR